MFGLGDIKLNKENEQRSKYDKYLFVRITEEFGHLFFGGGNLSIIVKLNKENEQQNKYYKVHKINKIKKDEK